MKEISWNFRKDEHVISFAGNTIAIAALAQNVDLIYTALPFFDTYSKASGAEINPHKSVAQVINGNFNNSHSPAGLALIDIAKYVEFTLENKPKA